MHVAQHLPTLQGGLYRRQRGISLAWCNTRGRDTSGEERSSIILAVVTHPTWLPARPSQCRGAGRQQQGQAAPPAPPGVQPHRLWPHQGPRHSPCLMRGVLFAHPLQHSDVHLVASLPSTQIPGSRHGPSGLLPTQGAPGPPRASGRQLCQEKAIYILASETAANFTLLVCLSTCGAAQHGEN